MNAHRTIGTDPRLDRWFFVGGALLVPLPILLFAVLQSAGVPPSAAEDLVTLAVMVPLGGPHVFATLARTFGDPAFPRRSTGLALASVAILVAVPTVAIASAFYDASIAGRPAMALLLTGFFFWAGLHVAQQHCHVAARLSGRDAAARAPLRLEVAVVVLALYPVSMFRMSMATPGGAAGMANPEALATRIMAWLGASERFTDDYVFRIGRATPVLPDVLLGPWPWILVTAAFACAFGALAIRSARRLRRGIRLGDHERLAIAAGVVGSLAPLAPNLDCAFQGINAWHCLQYLRLATLEHRESVGRGEVVSARLGALARPGRTGRAYAIAIGGTLTLVAAIVGCGFALEHASEGRFPLFGHSVPPTDPVTGRPVYRPGAMLLAYYLLGFGLLLVHYLQDTIRFARATQGRMQHTASPTPT